MSRTQWSDHRIGVEMAGAINAVAKASRSTITSAEITFTTPAERAEALAKAFRYGQLAGQMTNPVDADAYGQLAAEYDRRAGMKS